MQYWTAAVNIRITVIGKRLPFIRAVRFAKENVLMQLSSFRASMAMRQLNVFSVILTSSEFRVVKRMP
jgi:hypothetical protein